MVREALTTKDTQSNLAYKMYKKIAQSRLFVALLNGLLVLDLLIGGVSTRRMEVHVFPGALILRTISKQMLVIHSRDIQGVPKRFWPVYVAAVEEL